MQGLIGLGTVARHELAQIEHARNSVAIEVMDAEAPVAVNDGDRVRFDVQISGVATLTGKVLGIHERMARVALSLFADEAGAPIELDLPLACVATATRDH